MNQTMAAAEPPRPIAASRPRLSLATLAVSAFVLLIASVVTPSPARALQAAEATPTPVTKLRATLAQALLILHDQQMPVAQRRRELLQLAEQNLDLKRMAQGSLGDQWGHLTPNEREEFVGLFAAFIEEAYLVQIQDYVSLNITVSKGQLLNPDNAEVDATVIQPHEEVLPITFMLERRGDDWAIFDVRVEGISMVHNYRTQFGRVIRQQGLPQLMKDLREKQKSLASLIGQPS
jgi:phospholipid transport system substrate-binding protein